MEAQGFATATTIVADGSPLSADLTVPAGCLGLVVFAHGSGSGRLSPRNRRVAGLLQQERLGTLLFDLLTEEEERVDRSTGHLRFDLGLLSRRLVAAIDWAASDRSLRPLPLGCFGASTGAGAALMAAARRPGAVQAVVSRGGRPDLAGDALPAVRAPTLLIVGDRDRDVVRLNQEAQRHMTAPTRLELVPGATHLFEEPGALDHVARLAAAWFHEHLRENPG
jgi:dienelactone hydrolase